MSPELRNRLLATARGEVGAAWNEKVRQTMFRLRADALELGMRDLAAIYGASGIRLGQESLMGSLSELVKQLNKGEAK